MVAMVKNCSSISTSIKMMLEILLMQFKSRAYIKYSTYMTRVGWH